MEAMCEKAKHAHLSEGDLLRCVYIYIYISTAEELGQPPTRPPQIKQQGNELFILLSLGGLGSAQHFTRYTLVQSCRSIPKPWESGHLLNIFCTGAGPNHPEVSLGLDQYSGVSRSPNSVPGQRTDSHKGGDSDLL